MRHKTWLIRVAVTASLFSAIAVVFYFYQRSPLAKHFQNNSVESHHPRPRHPASIGGNLAGEVKPFGPLAKIDIVASKVSPLRASREALNSSHPSEETAVGLQAGLRLVAIVDNECAQTRQVANSNTSNASDEPLTAMAIRLAAKGTHPSLKIQAYAFDLPRSFTIAELNQLAANDSCLRQIVDEKKRSLHVPPHEKMRTLPVARDPATPAATPTATPTATPVASPTPAFTNDPLAAQQGHLTYLNATSAWQLFYKSGRPITTDVVVAVVDSGVDFTHQDLAGSAWQSATGAAGYDFVNAHDNPIDDLGHGTHVAGLLGAIANNALGGVGVMGQHLKIMSVKVIGADDTGTVSDLVNGIRYAADSGADVINLSLGGSDASSAEEDALMYAVSKGCFVAIAAGNEGGQVGTATFDYPSSYAPYVPGVLSVGSIDSASGQLSYFSNWSPTYVLIAAPGADDSTTDMGLLSTFPNNEYQRLEGTSMSTPLVSGAAALAYGVIKSGQGTPSPIDIANAILESATNDANLTAYIQNGAVLNLQRFSQTVQLRYMIDGDGGTGESP